MTTTDLANEMKSGTQEATANVAPSNHTPLFADNETANFRSQWQDVQASPACASGVSICSLIGFSNRPLKNTA